MSGFRSKRLRVQLPCGDATLVEEVDQPVPAADEGAGLSPAPCDWMHGSAVACAHLTCFDLPCHARFATPCVNDSGVAPPQCPAGFITPDLHCPHGVVSLPDCRGDSRPHGCLAVSCALDDSAPCGIDSCLENTGCYQTVHIVVSPDDPGVVAVAPEALPLLRRQLQARLRQIEQAELSKGSIEERLRELERAEQALAEPGGDDEPQR